ncbi:MAG: hypothetical protein JSR73_06200 [Proteobacteria bacterium]|nr:hypothetical protein [Pseudomonadota bacterium]
MKQNEDGSAVGWHVTDGQPQQLHVITLLSSTAPVPLQAPKAPELAGLAVFRSRRLEDGRERFRLHIGYFASANEAEQVLVLVRRQFPAAFVSLAPQSNLGSLEDTAVARFSILKPIEAMAEADIPAVEPPPAPPTVMPPPMLSPAEAVAVLQASDPAPVRVAAPAVTAPAAPAPAAAPAAKAAQRYAVQLVWSKSAIDLAQIPSLAIFAGYLIYAVETEVGGRRMYGVRLGFYADALSARLVSQYVRSEFKGVTVIPVSEREFTRASGAAIRLSTSRSSRGGSSVRPRWPAAAVAVDYVAAAASL